jgi:hypothetical protein
VTLFKNFSGREPYVEPLLIRRGLVAAEPGKSDSEAAKPEAAPPQNK